VSVGLSDQMTAALRAAPGPRHDLRATPETCFWGYFDRAQPPVLSIRSGDVVRVEAITHHAGDAPDLLMDDVVRAVWAGIPEADRGPGVHIMTGPIAVEGAEPGTTLLVRILEVAPRLPYGSNCAAHWGLLYDAFGKERITIYGLRGDGTEVVATPEFAYDFATRARYDVPGVVTPPDPAARQPFSRPIDLPVRPHLGVMGVAPAEPGRINSVPPGLFGGNVDNWRLGAGAAMAYPVFTPGAGLYVGDPHLAQGDGELCGTAIEASLDVTLQVSVLDDLAVTAPVLVTASHWFAHGFGDDLDEAMRMAAEQALWLLTARLGLSRDDAYSVASVAVDFGVTQVVDSKVGCHAAIPMAPFV
jgi:acetamidase/formamidase